MILERKPGSAKDNCWITSCELPAVTIIIPVVASYSRERILKDMENFDWNSLDPHDDTAGVVTYMDRDLTYQQGQLKVLMAK